MKSTSRPHGNRYALISTSDKSQLLELAKHLVDIGIRIIATDGSATFLKEHNIPALSVSEYTGCEELLDGRVKTLHPKIHAGILARRGIDEDSLSKHDINLIDFVIVNLYPFEHITQQNGCTLDKAIKHIDIGGSTLMRAAAKNYHDVTILTNPCDYTLVLNELSQQGKTQLNTRMQLAIKAFNHSTRYDQAISCYFQQASHVMNKPTMPEQLNLDFQKLIPLRYGENPQQQAACYSSKSKQAGSLVAADLLQGKALSYNNLLDADAALACVRALNHEQAACVIVKHATPCGAALGTNIIEAYQSAYQTDSKSCFGGIIAINQPLNDQLAQKIIDQQFVEVILAPSVTKQALTTLQQKPNTRILATGHSTDYEANEFSIRSISGGLLAQQCDRIEDETITTAGLHQPTNQQLEDLLFAWSIVAFNKSNAIVYAKNKRTLGIGTGQTSRVFSAEIAALKAKQADLSLTDAVMASDAFFPFPDSVELAARLGIKAIIQPGGSKRDNEVITTADRLGIAMVFTGKRHFRH